LQQWFTEKFSSGKRGGGYGSLIDQRSFFWKKREIKQNFEFNTVNLKIPKTFHPPPMLVGCVLMRMFNKMQDKFFQTKM
jgi:hypothetical protein